MPKSLLTAALLLLVPFAAHADDTAAQADDDGWSGSGEAGFAASRGNSKSENLNAKLQFTKEDERWKDFFYVTALGSKGEVTNTVVDNNTNPPTVVTTSNYETTSNRYEGGASTIRRSSRSVTATPRSRTRAMSYRSKSARATSASVRSRRRRSPAIRPW